jgi:steroid 5-alpha reductase family enzyme
MSILLNSSFLLLSLMVGIWGLSLWKRDASIVDRFWGLLFAFLSACYLIQSDEAYWRSALVMGLVLIWSVRLSTHIHLRNRGHEEDIRYQRMREEHGKSFWWYSFFSVFLLQGILALTISAPLYVIMTGSEGVGFTIFDGLGLIVWLVGFAFEAGGDWQLTKFKSKSENKGKLLTTGFWSLTRHPNYFGDACLWWGFYLFACSLPLGWVTFFGPLLMTLFIRYVSGVSLLEKDLSKTKPGYEDYVANTPAFFPKLTLLFSKTKGA